MKKLKAHDWEYPSVYDMIFDTEGYDDYVGIDGCEREESGRLFCWGDVEVHISNVLHVAKKVFGSASPRFIKQLHEGIGDILLKEDDK